MKKKGNNRYGIGEWYGQIFTELTSSKRKNYSTIKGVKKVKCPIRHDIDMCNKSGGVCSMASYHQDNDGKINFDENKPDFVTLCPNRFWQDNTIFKEIGKLILNTQKPILIKEVNFLQKVDSEGKTQKEFVGKIDLILTKMNSKKNLLDWCALEIQAVYFSGKGMNEEFKAIEKNPDHIFFPLYNRRPDFRSSGPKRLMPQLEIKIPTLRRWGKKMVIVIDKPFFESIAPMKNVPSLSNADIAWFVVNYEGRHKILKIHRVVYTTLESSVEGLTAGIPVSKEKFERELKKYTAEKNDKLITLFN